MADAAIYLMQNYNGNTPVNIGTGIDISIRELATQIKQSIGFTGELIFDTSMPDGTPRKLLDVSLANQLGWHAQTNLKTGIQKTLDWYVANILDIRK